MVYDFDDKDEVIFVTVDQEYWTDQDSFSKNKKDAKIFLWGRAKLALVVCDGKWVNS